MPTSSIKIRTLIGPGIKTYIPSIAKVREQVLSEIPYIKLNSEADLEYLRYLSLSKDAIAVLVFDGSQVIGVSTGIPLSDEVAEVQEPFIKNRLPLEDYYYFGLSALLKPYRSRGISHHFFSLRENHVLHLKRFSKICFTSVLPPPDGLQPPERIYLEMYWKKRGYVEHPEMTCRHPIIDSGSSPSLKLWIKQVSPVPLSQGTPLDDFKENLEIVLS